MGIRSTLALKVIAGIGVVSMTSWGVIHLSNKKFNNDFICKALIEKIRLDDNYKFEKDGSIEEAFTNNSKTVTLTASQINISGQEKTWTWKCLIKFTSNKNGSFDNTEKGIFDNFIEKITGSKHKPFKERFVKHCSDSEITTDSKLIDNTFESTINISLNSNGTNLKVKNLQEYKDLFGPIKLTEEEKRASSSNEKWKLSSGNDQSPKYLQLENINYKETTIDGCKVVITSTPRPTMEKTFLNEKLGAEDKEVNEGIKKNRRAFLKKCRNNNNELSFNMSVEGQNTSQLFDFSDETLTNEEKSLVNLSWQDPEVTIKDSSVSVNIQVKVKDGEEVKHTFKINGEKRANETIDKTHLTNSQEEIKNAIKTEIQKTENRQKRLERFILKSKKTLEGEIDLFLKKKGNEDKYELENLDQLFSKN